MKTKINPGRECSLFGLNLDILNQQHNTMPALFQFVTRVRLTLVDDTTKCTVSNLYSTHRSGAPSVVWNSHVILVYLVNVRRYLASLRRPSPELTSLRHSLFSRGNITDENLSTRCIASPVNPQLFVAVISPLDIASRHFRRKLVDVRRFVPSAPGIWVAQPQFLRALGMIYKRYECTRFFLPSFKTKGNLTKHMKSKAHTKNYAANSTCSSNSPTVQSGGTPPTSESETEDSGMDSSGKFSRCRSV